MHRVLLLLCLLVAAPIARAADASGATAAPNADNSPAQGPSGQTAAAALSAADCPDRPPLAQGAPSAIVVSLDPNTLWRPRGSEVRFTISNPGGSLNVAKVRVCFGWSSSDGDFRRNQALVGSPQVRSVGNDTGAIEYGALVPLLHRIPDNEWWPRRIMSATAYTFTGVFTVPVADMVVEVTTTAGQVVLTATQVGVTSVIVAWVVVAVIALLLWAIMDGITRFRRIEGRNLLLRVISTRDGYASLSQLQIVLWTLVVGLSAIYVMTLSGNLISVSDGTLVLLGIASAAALAARVPELEARKTDPTVAVVPVAVVPVAVVPAAVVPVAAADAAGEQVPVAAPLPAAVPVLAVLRAKPEWSDLVIPDRASQEIDVTRLQMLAFTLITASFVLVKVIVEYEIPTIPANFLLLMGISNGVYVGGRKLPSLPKKGGTAAGP